MSFFKKLFGAEKSEENKGDGPSGSEPDKALPWIEAAQNPWKIRLLDLRPITQKMLSTSKDQQAATNAVSYGGEDGTVFRDQQPPVEKKTKASLSFAVEGRLVPGVLFIPQTMEHKWAIYFDGETIRFVRSWQRRVFVIARVVQEENVLKVVEISGEFTQDESPEFTSAILSFLLATHALGVGAPAPLPKGLESDTYRAGLWAFSAYGNMAQVGVFDLVAHIQPAKPLRTHSLLHIAVARGDLGKIEQLAREGYPLNGLAGDGLAPLHWANDVGVIRKLLELGADPNARSAEGATPIMNAVQSDKMEQLTVLMASGALVNARDNRGFTALHRAAEMGKVAMVELLLREGADKSIEAQGHTALSFAKARGHEPIIELLS